MTTANMQDGAVILRFMTIAISHISAARYWLSYGLPDVPRLLDKSACSDSSPLQSGMEGRSASGIGAQIDSAGLTSLRGMLCSQSAKRLFDLSGCAVPSLELIKEMRAQPFLRTEERLHLLVCGQPNRRKVKGVLCHSGDRPLPSGSVLTMRNGLRVCSPSLTFVQMGSLLPVPLLVCFGMALCGIFAVESFVNPPECSFEHAELVPPQSNGLPARTQIMSVDKMARYLESAPHLPGFRRARTALQYVLERSRSPMESVSALMLSMPRRAGGFGLPKPTLNCRVALDSWLHGGVSDRSANLRGALPFAESDMVFSYGDIAVHVDYHGKDYHAGESDLHHDSLKANAYAQKRIPYFILTKQQVSNLALFEKFALQLADSLGWKPRRVIANQAQRRAALHRILLKGISVDDLIAVAESTRRKRG